MNSIDIGWLLPIIIPVTIAICYAMIVSPRIWLSVTILCLPVFLQASGEGLSVIEVLFGIFYTVPVIFWMCWRIATSTKSLFSWWGDVFIMLFLVASGLNIVVAMLNDVEAIKWLSEWSLFFLLLYYFPLREYFGGSEKEFKQLLSVASVASFVMALSSLYMYRQKMASGFAFAYQVWSSRSVLLGPVFLLVIVVALALLFHSSYKGKIFLLGLILVNALALFLTFTRTLWVSFFLCLPIIMLQLRPKQNFRLAFTMVGASAFALVSLYIYNPRITSIVGRVVSDRFLSSSQLKGGDGSFDSRVDESKSALKHIQRLPLGGSGLRKPFLTWSPIENYHGYHSFVHIGYIGLIYKLGIPTAVIFFTCIGMFFYRSIQTYWRQWHGDRTNFIRGAAIGVGAFMPALMIIMFMSGFFDERYGEFMFAFIFAMISITHDLTNKKTIENKRPHDEQ